MGQKQNYWDNIRPNEIENKTKKQNTPQGQGSSGLPQGVSCLSWSILRRSML